MIVTPFTTWNQQSYSIRDKFHWNYQRHYNSTPHPHPPTHPPPTTTTQHPAPPTPTPTPTHHPHHPPTTHPLVQVMACRLDCAKPLCKPMLEYCWFDPWEQTFQKMHLKMSSAKLAVILSRGKLLKISVAAYIAARETKGDIDIVKTSHAIFQQI